MEAQTERRGPLAEAGLADYGPEDVTRRLFQLAYGRANDCVRLAMAGAEIQGELDRLDLSLLAEVRRSEKGAVEIKLLDRLAVLEQLDRRLSREKGEDPAAALLQALGAACQGQGP